VEPIPKAAARLRLEGVGPETIRFRHGNRAKFLRGSFPMRLKSHGQAVSSEGIRQYPVRDHYRRKESYNRGLAAIEAAPAQRGGGSRGRAFRAHRILREISKHDLGCFESFPHGNRTTGTQELPRPIRWVASRTGAVTDGTPGTPSRLQTAFHSRCGLSGGDGNGDHDSPNPENSRVWSAMHPRQISCRVCPSSR